MKFAEEKKTKIDFTTFGVQNEAKIVQKRLLYRGE